MKFSGRTIIAREDNVIRVDFRREPDPPAPRFPGAGALRGETECADHADGSSRTVGLLYGT